MPTDPKPPVKKRAPKKTTAVTVRRNPYAEKPKEKVSATFELFRDVFLGTRANLDPEGFDALQNKYGNSSTWVYIAVKRIADAMAQIPFQVIDINREGKPNQVIRNYDRGLNDLLRQPNPFQRRFDFLEVLAISLELTGNCFIELVKDAAGRPYEMYVLNPSRISIIPDRKNFVGGYVYTVNGRHIAFRADEIIHIKYHHPMNDYYGLSPLTAARVAVEGDQAALEWNRNFLLRGSWPAGAIQTDNDLGEPEVRRLQRMIRATMQQGKDQAGRLLLLTGGLKYNPLAIKPKDADWLDARRMSRDEILSIFGVPFAVAGLFSTEQTTARSAGVELQIKQFYRNTIFPKVEKITSALNRVLMPMFRAQYELRPDYRAVPALQEEVDQELTRSQTLKTLTDAGLSLNKALARLYPDVPPEPWGDVSWMANSMVPVSSDQPPVAAAPNPNTPNPNTPPAKPTPPNPAKQLMAGAEEEWERICELASKVKDSK